MFRVFSVTYYFKLHNATLFSTQRVFFSNDLKSFLLYNIHTTYLIFVDAQRNLLLEVVTLRNPRYGVILIS